MGKPNVKNIADCLGLSPQFIFAMDTQSQPGKTICHFVRLETIVFEDSPDFDKTTLNTLHADGDKRLIELANCFTHGLQEAVREQEKALLRMSAHAVEKKAFVFGNQLAGIAANLKAISEV